MPYPITTEAADQAAREDFFQPEAKERKQSVLVILRRCYLNLVSNHCAAKLIEYFKHWREWKLATHRTDWIYMPLKKIREDLMNEHSLHVIRAAIALLESKGFLKKRHNPGNGQDKTYQYQLQVEVIKRSLSESGEVSSEVPEFRNELPSIAVESHTQDPPLEPSSSFTPTTNGVVKEEEEVSQEKIVNDLSETRELLAEIRERTGVILNPDLQKLVATTAAAVVREAIAAWLEWSKGKKLDKPPAVSLAKAIKEQWKSEQPAALKKIVNPPSMEQMALLEQLKRDRVINDIYTQPFKDGETYVVYDGKQVTLWWEYLKSR